MTKLIKGRNTIMKNQHFKHIAELNMAMLLISSSGVLGRYIAMSPGITIWWRCFFAAIFLGAFCWYKKIDLRVSTIKDWKIIILSGLFLGVHWITYFYSLQLSNVAIAMLSIFTYPVITVFLEPFFFKTSLNLKHVLLGCLVLLGVYFLTPELNIENDYTKGILMGVISAVFYALRNLLLKKRIAKYDSSMLMFYQMLAILIFLWPAFTIFEGVPSMNEWQAIVILALLTTAIGHTLFVRSFKNFSISSASIMSSVQPIYGILLGILFLGEIPSYTTIIGGVLILSTVVIESIQSSKA